MTVTFLSRAQWGAGDLGSGHRVPHAQFVGLVAHHTVSVMSDYDRDGFLHGDLDDVIRYMRQLQHARPDLGDEVPYSFVTFESDRPGNCIVAEGRGFGVTGAHTAGFNSSRYGVAVAGNTTTRAVTAGMLAGYRWVGARLADPAGARQTIGHRDTKATECPGNTLYAALGLIQPPFDQEDDPLAQFTEEDLIHAAQWAIRRELAGEGQTPRQAILELATRGATAAIVAQAKTAFSEWRQELRVVAGLGASDQLEAKLDDLDHRLDDIAASLADPAPTG